MATPTDALAELRAALRTLEHPDPFAALGLRWQADLDKVRKRYAELVEQYHPHHYARFDDPEITATATRCFLALQKAHRGCREVAGRGSVAGRATDAGARSGSAQAISEALSLLGLAQYEAAANVIERALKKAPGDDALTVTRFIIEARRCRAAGDALGAINAYDEVLDIDASHEEAKRERQHLVRDENSEPPGLLKGWFKGFGR
jgi:tetratricopeptide (TPR) repeat protein